VRVGVVSHPLLCYNGGTMTINELGVTSDNKLTTIEDVIIEMSIYPFPPMNAMANPSYFIQARKDASRNYSGIKRTDRKLIDSLAMNVFGDSKWTRRQQVTAVNLVNRYKNQLERKGHNICHLVDNPKFLNKPRDMDYTSTVIVEDDHFIVQFPFNKEMVNAFKNEQRKTDSFLMEFNSGKRTWKIKVREDMLVFLMRWPSLKGDAQFNEWAHQARIILDEAI